jgi:phosphatidate cytidylyltransferase
MTNNTVRIISGLILLALVGFALYLGQKAALISIGVMGPFVIDEIITNFYDQPRVSFRYFLAQGCSFFCYYFFNFYQISNSSFSFWISAGIVLNILLFAYLFIIYKKSETLLRIFKATSWGAGLFVVIPVICLSYIIHFDNWINLFIGLMILNFMVDTAAYFTGKKFGKHKLWEAVSPKKTVEGLMGGVFFSVLATSLYWNHFIDKVNVFTVLFFTIVACCSQVGDLAQSK